MSFREDVDALNTRFLEASQRRDAVGARAGLREGRGFLGAGTEPVRGERR